MTIKNSALTFNSKNKKMKTFSLKQFVRIKAVFNTPDEPAVMNEAGNPGKTTSATGKRKSATLQRKAHTGNFFAGPHCVFDPRLF
jgi:hypothetical protein